MIPSPPQAIQRHGERVLQIPLQAIQFTSHYASTLAHCRVNPAKTSILFIWVCQRQNQRTCKQTAYQQLITSNILCLDWICIKTSIRVNHVLTSGQSRVLCESRCPARPLGKEYTAHSCCIPGSPWQNRTFQLLPTYKIPTCPQQYVISWRSNMQAVRTFFFF